MNAHTALKNFLKHRRIVQFLEYMVGGGVYFWTGICIFALLYSVFGWAWLPAKAVADAIGWTLNYLIQRYWAFADKRLAHSEGKVRIRYIIINSLDFAIDYAIIAGITAFGITPYIGFFVSAAFTTVWDYLWYRFWVFVPSKT